MPSGGSSSGTSTVTQKSDPWSGIQPGLLQAAKATQGLFNQGSGTPDVAAYQKALSAWQAAGNNPNAPMTLDQYVAAGNTAGSYKNYLGRQPKGVSTNTNPMPTQDQFMLPGTGNSSGNPLAPNYYPGSTVAPFAPQQQQAIDLTTQRALNGSPVNAANQGMLTSTLNGNYLDPNSNPYLKDTYNQAANAVTGSINGSFGQRGRYGSGLNQYTLGQNLNNLATNIYGGNYTNERNNQLKAGLEAPTAANQDYTDLGALANAGAQVQGQNQANLSDAINRYYYTASQPATQIQNYVGLLQGTGGNYGTTTQSSPYYTNPAANALGLGLGGIGMLNGINGLTSGSGLLSASSAPWLASLFA